MRHKVPSRAARMLAPKDGIRQCASDGMTVRLPALKCFFSIKNEFFRVKPIGTQT
jgi:hypothetical protein